jgi:hypothetical protein
MGIIGILVHVRTKPDFDFDELVVQMRPDCR